MYLTDLTPRNVSADDLAIIDDERLRRLAEYWLEKRAGRPVTRRADIDPIEMKWILPHVWLHEVEPGTGRQKCRLAGEEVQAMYPTAIVGKYLDEYVLTKNWHVIETHYRGVIDGPAIGYAKGQVYQAALDQLGHGERIGLPLSDEAGRHVIMMLGATIYKPFPTPIDPTARREGVQRLLIPLTREGAAGRSQA